MDHVVCQLCSKPFMDPRILPCLHSFCSQCLSKKVEDAEPQRSLQCPTCLRKFPIPPGGASVLTRNLHLGYEVEIAEYMSKFLSDHAVSCTFCVNGCSNHAVVFCCSCRMFLCKAGQDCHKYAPQLFAHSVVGLDKESATLLPTIMKPAELYCTHLKHKKQELDFYCKSCNSSVCRDCIISSHKDHNFTELSTVAETHRDEMRRALTCAQKDTSVLAAAIDTNNKMTQQMETSKQEAELAIKHAFRLLLETLEQRKKALLTDLEAISLSKTTALTLQKEQLMKIQDEIGHYTEMTSHILQTHTDHEVVALGDLLPTELKATLKKVENVSLTPNQTSNIHVSLHTDDLIKELSIFGQVMDSSPSSSQSTWSSESVAKVKEVYCVKVETVTSKGERYPYGGLLVKAELRPKSHDGAVVPEEVEDHGDGTYTITLIPQTAGPHQLLITMDGQHVQKSPCDLNVRREYSTLCKPELVINCSGGPTDIAIHDSGDIYVSCLRDNSIHVFDQAGHQKRTIGSGGSGDGQFNHPHGLLIKGDMMYVADRNNHCIQKLTTGGQFLQKFCQHGSGQGQFSSPISVIVDQRDRLIVSDCSNHRVVMLDQAGTWLLTINGNVFSSHAFQRPYGLALDPQGNIHVAAFGSNTINVFTPEGTYVRSYGDVKGPSGIVIDEEGYSLVNERDGNCFSIFDQQGNKVHTIGNLNKPLGVILDPKRGSLYVANYGANTVLKYSTL